MFGCVDDDHDYVFVLIGVFFEDCGCDFGGRMDFDELNYKVIV